MLRVHVTPCLPGQPAQASELAAALAPTLLLLPQLPGGGGLWSLPLSLPLVMLLLAASSPSGSSTGASSGMPALPGSPCTGQSGRQGKM